MLYCSPQCKTSQIASLVTQGDSHPCCEEATMKFGACVWPFQWNPPYEDTIRRIAGLGFRAVELIAWDRQTLDDYYTPQRIQALRRLLTDEGLELSEFVSTPAGMASPDPGRREQAVEHFKRQVEVGV